MPTSKPHRSSTAPFRRLRQHISISASLLIGSLALSGCSRSTATSSGGDAPAPPQIPALRVTAQDIPDVLTFTGHIEAVHRVELRPRVSGTITAVSYSEGARVSKDTPLFQIDSRPYQARRDQAAAELDRSRATRQHASLELVRARRLREDRAVSLEDLDRRAAEFATAEAQENAARAGLTAAELDLEFTTVQAPIGGMTSRAHANIGDYVHAGSTHLATLVSTDPIHVLFDVDEPAYQRIQAVRRDPKAPLVLQLTTAGSKKRMDGILDYVANTVETSTGTAQLRAVVSNAERLLAAGMFARIEMHLPAAGARVLVPETALGSEQGSRYVLVAGADNILEHRQVALGSRVGDQRIIISGIQQDDVVLLGGHQWLRPGMAVTPVLQSPRAQMLTVTQH